MSEYEVHYKSVLQMKILQMKIVQLHIHKKCSFPLMKTAVTNNIVLGSFYSCHNEYKSEYFIFNI
jgi:hypothetical protein